MLAYFHGLAFVLPREISLVPKNLARRLAWATWTLYVLAAGSSLAESPAVTATDSVDAEREYSPTDLVGIAKESVVVIRVQGRDGNQASMGTGFVVSAGGLIATNLHVIGEARPISVLFADGRQFEVSRVEASDHLLDLALLKVDPDQPLTPLPLGNSDQLQQGARMVVVGNPHGLANSVVEGIVSGRREVEGRPMIQLAIPIEPGNSGSPALDLRGRVQGLVTMKSAITDNLGFAVPVNELRALLDRPNPIPMSRWLTIGTLDRRHWNPLLGATWRQRHGEIVVQGAGQGFGGRALCLVEGAKPELPFEVAVKVRMQEDSGAAGLIFHSDGQDQHYGFYPSSGRLRLSRFEGPDVYSWTVLHETQSVHYRSGDWNHLKVRVEPGRILCYVNEQLVIESRDAKFTSGQVGLVKFRETSAHFKQFRVARTLPSQEISAELTADILQLYERLPAWSDLTADQLDPLTGRANLSMQVARQRAESLQAEAARLTRIADAVHAQAVIQQLTQTLEQPEGDLAQAALLVSWLDNPELDIDAVREDISRMAVEIRSKFPEDATADARVLALNEYLFSENGFHGSRTDYYHRSNSYLDQVVHDREGIPITLAVLYMELGKRLGLTLEGVGLPGHFLVRLQTADPAGQLIDVFDRGKALTTDDARRMVGETTSVEWKDEYLASITSRQIIQRMLRNLLGVAQNAQDRPAMLRYLDALLAIDPDSAEVRLMRTLISADERRDAVALGDLDWLLENAPEGLDLNRLRGLREFLRNRAP